MFLLDPPTHREGWKYVYYVEERTLKKVGVTFFGKTSIGKIGKKYFGTKLVREYNKNGSKSKKKL